MKLLVGLGNPGRDYAGTRHNIGFFCIDELARRHSVQLTTVRMQAMTNTVQIGAERALLAKPQTYMNLSGDAVGALVSFYKISPADIIVVADDLDLPFGKLRLRWKGGAGGHNGLRSIIERLGTQEFARIRVGIGRPPGQKGARDYVLEHFTADEQQELPILCGEVADALEMAVKDNFEAAMNRYNGAGTGQQA